MEKSFEQKLKKLLKGAEDFNENKDFWEFLHDSYKGGKSYIKNSYLVKHQRETSSNYKRRKDLSSYTNVVAPVVDLYTSYIYSQNIQRSYEVPSVYETVVESITENIDNNENNLSELMAKVAKWTMVYGRMLVMVDSPKSEAKSLQGNIDEGSLPYVTMYPPTSVVNYKLSRPGQGKRKLEMLLLSEGDDDITKEEYFKLWTNDEWYLISKLKDKITIVDAGVNEIGKIPAVSITYKDGFSEDLDDGESLVSDISYMSKRIFNLDSNAYEIIEQSAYPILEIPHSPGDDTNIELGVGNALPYDKNHPESRAAWIEPVHSSLGEILSWRNQIFADVQYISHTLGAAQKDAAESGLALETRLLSLSSTLGTMSKKLEKAEQKIISLVFLYLGIDASSVVNYPKSFGVRNLSEDIDNAIKSANLINSPSYKSKISMVVAEKVMGKMAGESEFTKDDKESMRKEMEGVDPNILNNV